MKLELLQMHLMSMLLHPPIDDPLVYSDTHVCFEAENQHGLHANVTRERGVGRNTHCASWESAFGLRRRQICGQDGSDCEDFRCR
jgi:hypothetical protein